MAASLIPRKLAQLTVDMTNTQLTVLVLSKSQPRYFMSDKNEYRGVISYFVRDSKEHLVNCKYWGSKEKVEEYQRTFQIGDIVDITCPRVESCMQWMAHGEKDTVSAKYQTRPQFRFQPLPTLPITLVLNESQSTLGKHDSHDKDTCRYLFNLMRVSHKQICSVLQLADVRCTAGSIEGADNNQVQFVDLLVVVANMSAVKKIPSRKISGTMLKCLDLVVFDKSTPQGVLFSIWQPDWIHRAEQYWQSMRTILHLIEVRATYSEFYRKNLISFTARSLIYENPYGRECQELGEFAATITMQDLDFFAVGAESTPKPEQIVTQMTVVQIYTRALDNLKDDTKQFTAVLCGMVTHFDIDNNLRKFCKRLLAKTQIVCEPELCHLAFKFNHNEDKYEHFFNINIQFSDHTGTVTEARLCASTAERVLKVGVDEFLRMDDAQKKLLKWRFLFEHFEFKLLIKKTSAVQKNIAITVICAQSI